MALVTRDPGGHHAARLPSLPLRPYRPRVGSVGASAGLLRRARPSTEVARQARIADAAVFYLLRSGCAWRMLPREYPPWQTVYYHFSGSGVGTDGCAEPTTGSVKRWGKPKGVSQRPEWCGDRQPRRQGERAGRPRARLRRGQAALREEASPARRHRRARALGAHVHAASLHDRDGAQKLLSDEF